MIKERYVDFETAKLLKRKGFDERCKGFYSIWNNLNGDKDYGKFKFWEGEGSCHSEFKDWKDYEMVSAPTYQMVCSWLRQKSIHITVHYSSPDVSLPFYGSLVNLKDGASLVLEKSFATAEEAEEHAVKFYLEKYMKDATKKKHTKGRAPKGV